MPVWRVSDAVSQWALLLALTGVLPGCSFLFTTAPKQADSPAEFVSKKCTTSKAAPIVDTVIAGLEGVRTGIAVAADKSVYENAPISRGADIGLGLGFLALFGASAIYGYYVTGECSSRHDRALVAEPPKDPDQPRASEPNERDRPRRVAPDSQLAP